MELPLNIIITLLIALVVGLMIVNFSNHLLIKSQNKLNEINQRDIKIIKVNNLNTTQAAYLAESCMKSNINKGLCFVVIINNNLNCDNNIIWDFLGYDNSNLESSGNGKTIYFYKGSKEEVRIECR